MKRTAVLSMVVLAGAAFAGEKKTYSYTCKGGKFTITAAVDSAEGVDRWSKTEPVILQIAAAGANSHRRS